MNISDLVKEVQDHERRRSIVELCGETSVQAVNCIVLNGVTHSGVVSHKCGLRVKHTEKSCECRCGYSWLSR